MAVFKCESCPLFDLVTKNHVVVCLYSTPWFPVMRNRKDEVIRTCSQPRETLCETARSIESRCLRCDLLKSHWLIHAEKLTPFSVCHDETRQSFTTIRVNFRHVNTAGVTPDKVSCVFGPYIGHLDLTPEMSDVSDVFHPHCKLCVKCLGWCSAVCISCRITALPSSIYCSFPL